MVESGTIALFVSIIAVSIAVFFGVLGWKFQRKKYRSSMLLIVFDELSTDKAREKREKVYHFYCKYKLEPTEEYQYEHVDFDKTNDEIKKNFKGIREIANSVELSMERVCLLAEEDLIDKKEIKKHYGEMIVKSWKALRYDIEIHQSPNREGYAVNFDKLAKEFCDDKKDPIDPKIDCTKKK